MNIKINLVLILIFSYSSALAEIYHCENADGSLSYQDSPCENQTLKVEENIEIQNQVSFLSASACMYESNLRSQVQGEGKTIKNCIENITGDKIVFLETCRDIRDLAKERYADTSMTTLDACPSGAVAICEKDINQTVNRHFYGYGSEFLAERPPICRNWGGTWILNEPK